MKYIIVSRRRGFPPLFYYNGNFYWHIFSKFNTKDEAYEIIKQLSSSVILGQMLTVTTEDNYERIWSQANKAS